MRALSKASSRHVWTLASVCGMSMLRSEPGECAHASAAAASWCSTPGNIARVICLPCCGVLCRRNALNALLGPVPAWRVQDSGSPRWRESRGEGAMLASGTGVLACWLRQEGPLPGSSRAAVGGHAADETVLILRVVDPSQVSCMRPVNRGRHAQSGRGRRRSQDVPCDCHLVRVDSATPVKCASVRPSAVSRTCTIRQAAAM